MAKDDYPSVFVVDSHTTRPPIPPRLNHGRRRAGAAQTLLFLLVGVALCGMVIEACFIFHLYRMESASSASSSKFTGGEDVTSPTMWPSYDILPSKPVAHLTDGQDAHHGPEIMAWSMIADPLLYEMEYKGNSLIIQKEGYYYVYSKKLLSKTPTELYICKLRRKWQWGPVGWGRWRWGVSNRLPDSLSNPRPGE
ncbi:tumor necrosis factor ligand superfamily member 14-like protein [Lates japonicus]|uniref:Tumor necrosis factor ligand superfamily member 14-like protein n=1 Tax=Lates japonicus TaxID=270547 RepID=A0AAD3M8L5_LATJO|nr:tumor necrosis factor ligand superfamily member 14-like protein [Lates japonicus]